MSKNTWDYTENIIKYKLNFFIHGDDWKNGNTKKTREKVKKCLRKYIGKLVEVKYTKNISSSEIKNKIIKNTMEYLKENRISRLKRLAEC